MKKIALNNASSVIHLLSLLDLKDKELDVLGVDVLEVCVFKENKLLEGDYDSAGEYRAMERAKINEIVQRLKALQVIQNDALILDLSGVDNSVD